MLVAASCASEHGAADNRRISLASLQQSLSVLGYALLTAPTNLLNSNNNGKAASRRLLAHQHSIHQLRCDVVDADKGSQS